MGTKKVGIPAGITGPQIAEAMVAMVEARADRSAKACGVKTARQVEGLAKIGVELCKKGVCFFCAGAYIFKLKLKNKKIVWGDFPLHSCMDELREKDRPVAARPVTAQAPSRQKAPRTEKPKEKPSKSYVEHYAWHDLENLREQVKAGAVKPTDKMYSDTCAVKTCRKPFDITAGIIVRALNKNKRYTQQRKCKDCALKAINAQLEAAGLGKGITPQRKQFKKLDELTASIGEIASRHATAEEQAVHDAVQAAETSAASSV
jgi:hypothetical protein